MLLSALPLSVLVAALAGPAWVLAAMVLLGGIAGDWARVALTGWVTLCSALLAGASGGSFLSAAVLLLGFAALMTGGPWGPALAALAVLPLLAVASGLPGGRMLALFLLAPAAIAGARLLLTR